MNQDFFSYIPKLIIGRRFSRESFQQNGKMVKITGHKKERFVEEAP
jgi:hypothetical protein